MEYRTLADAYAQIERTAARTEMTRALAELVRAAPPDDLPRVVLLTQGRLAPDYEGVEIGIAERLAVRAVAQSAGADEAEVRRVLHRVGDLGEAARLLLARRRPRAPLTVAEVHETLRAIAEASGEGSQERRQALLRGLLARATPAEAKYLLRTVTGTLRLGVGDMTMLDALAAVFADRGARPALERAYNLSSDLGLVAETLARGGLPAIEAFRVRVGRPIRPMLAERSRTAAEILEKHGGETWADYKYDGERVQVHLRGGRIEVFSRRLERITGQYPEVASLVLDRVRARAAVIEGEVVAIEPQTGDPLPFQELMRRRRKHGIEEAMRERPAALRLFDLLYLNGRDLTRTPLADRVAALARIVDPAPEIRLVESRRVRDVEALERVMEQAVGDGMEGLVCKAPASVYRAGARGWQWIKYKREYQSALTDSVDLVAVGALYGRGRRGGTYGALLLSAYDAATDTFPSVTKCGSGFTDADLARLPERLAPHRLEHRHPRVTTRMEVDVWFEPALVLEVVGAELTLSPVHTAALGAVRDDAGLAIRFPRFTGRYRDDKRPEDATTTAELLSMYRRRRRVAP